MQADTSTRWQPLPRAEVINAIERRYPTRIPLVRTKWWGEGFEELHGDALRRFDPYPEDADVLFIEPVVAGNDGTLLAGGRGGRTRRPRRGGRLGQAGRVHREAARPGDRTRRWMRCVERAAEAVRARDRVPACSAGGDSSSSDRGAFAACRICSWTITCIPTRSIGCTMRCARITSPTCNGPCATCKPDGFWTSDDLGHQKQLFMSPDTFRDLIKPYYMRIGEFINAHDLHWWLHSCGNNTAILDDLVEAGVDVFHPVQKGTMDYASVAAEYGDRMTFLVGFDVQHVLQEDTPEQVRAEVRHIIDTFDRPDGGMCMAAGNGILPGTPLENMEAFLDETLRYGAAHRQQRSAGRAQFHSIRLQFAHEGSPMNDAHEALAALSVRASTQAQRRSKPHSSTPRAPTSRHGIARLRHRLPAPRLGGAGPVRLVVGPGACGARVRGEVRASQPEQHRRHRRRGDHLHPRAARSAGGSALRPAFLWMDVRASEEAGTPHRPPATKRCATVCPASTPNGCRPRRSGSRRNSRNSTPRPAIC